MVGAEDLLTAWTAGKTLLSMLIGSACQSDALSADWGGRAGALRRGRRDGEGRAGTRALTCGSRA